MKQKIFAVMGATGHIGRVIVEELLKRGHIVRAIGRNEGKLYQLELKGADTYSINYDDSKALTEAFRDTFAIFSLLPPAYTEKNYSAFQETVSKAICTAVSDSECRRVINLSSIGADLDAGTGPIIGLHNHEKKLNNISSLETLIHLRPDFFMENLEKYLPMIKNAGVIQAPIDQNLPIAMIATRDIGWKAADFMDSTAPFGNLVFEFIGPKNITMNYVAEIFGQVFDHPELWYDEISMNVAREEMLGSGMQPEITDLMIEMYEGFNSGLIVPSQEIKPTHRGITTLDEYAHMLAHKLFSYVRK